MHPSQQDNLKAARAKRGFGVAPSPFNAVKFELGVILCIIILASLLLDSITSDAAQQIMILFILSAAAALWLFLRTRTVLQKEIAQKEIAQRHSGETDTE